MKNYDKIRNASARDGRLSGYFVLKRSLDVLFSLFAVILLAPLFFGIAAWIKRESHGPVFFSGLRIGKNGRPFRMLKFRTMIADADKIGGSSTPGDDPRLTRVGKFLRRYKLDELPQFLNVLRGEMSFVGPRPQVEWAVKLYTEEEKAVMGVSPGITDFASIRFRNEAEILRGSRNPDQDYLEKIAPEKMRLALEYVRKQSLGVDLKIILATAGTLLGLPPDWIFRGSEAGKKELIPENQTS